MASTLTGLVYSQATGRLRRIIIPDDDSQILAVDLHPGEAITTVTTSAYQALPDLNAHQGAVNSVTGKTPSGDRYVALDAGNNVVSVHIADPLCGDAAPQPGTTLVAHATANVGDVLWGGTTVAPNKPISAPLLPSQGQACFRVIQRRANDLA